MTKRQVILALAAVLVLAIAIPAIGSRGSLFNLANHANRKSKRALHRSSRALNRSSRALRRGHHGVRQANIANSTANTANSTATTASQRLASTQIVSAIAPGQVHSDNALGDYENLGGPSVTVNVPSSGLIEVWGQADIRDDNGGAVALFQDGQIVQTGTDPDLCGVGDLLFMMGGGGSGSFATFGTPATPGILGCTSTGQPGPVMLSANPGTHTFDLRYSDCGCGGGADFRNRILRVGPRI
jgi:hypothetical protein